jgi:hydroxyacylglutathione hydrolase
MIFRQITHDDLGCASYLVGDEDAGVAAVFDPKLEVEEYLALARYMGVRIEHVVETHNHADHVSGHGRLVAATGATIHIHRDATPAYDHVAFDDGWELRLGRVLVHALHTPGHRPEHTAFALVDTARGDAPWAVLTGDALFVGDLGRPDLAVEKEEGARGLFRSLHAKLLALPESCEVWPGHLGGSLCGGPGMDMKVSSTIGYERAHNALLREEDESRFVERALAALTPQPPNFRAIVELNRAPLHTGIPELEPLTPHEVERHTAAGGLVVDVRTDFEFDEAHVPGAVCNPAVRAGFGTKLAWLADHDHDVVFVGRDDGDALRAARLAAAVGISQLGGYLTGGMTSWHQEHRRTQALRRIDVDALHDLLSARDDVQVLDVRERSEWEQGRIPRAVNVPYHDIRRIPDALGADRPIAVICSSGQRSATAASLLQRAGAREPIHVAGGGVGTWERRGLPIERPEAAGVS